MTSASRKQTSSDLNHWFISDRKIIFGVISVGILILSAMIVFVFAVQPPEIRETGNGALIIGSAFIAWISLLANVWLNRRQARAQQTLQLLSTVRLDREYLGFAKAFREILPGPGEVMPDAVLDLILKRQPDGTVRSTPFNESEKNFRQAASFLLNFYEMVAVATYRQDLDPHLLQRTIRGNVIRLVITCSPWIAHTRSKPGKDKSWEHLVWFYHRFALTSDLPAGVNTPADLDLGPIPKL
ncbi:DUF4760 domain-containing protein [Rhodobacteraceae bacterium NNCM2]|nr:DUF4760 domain-containing protein [Coraliihabitans acroporae]